MVGASRVMHADIRGRSHGTLPTEHAVMQPVDLGRKGTWSGWHRRPRTSLRASADPASPVQVGLLMVCFMGCVVLMVLKGNGAGSIIGVECGSGSFWMISLATVPWVISFGVAHSLLGMPAVYCNREDGFQQHCRRTADAFNVGRALVSALPRSERAGRHVDALHRRPLARANEAGQMKSDTD